MPLPNWRITLALAAVSCAASTPGAQPHDMSAAHHEREAQSHAAAADSHSAQYAPGATVEQDRCSPRPGDRSSRADSTAPCWTSSSNPTAEHRRAAEEHRRHAVDHRAASAALREAEARSCVDVPLEDRDMSPFAHVDDITAVDPLVEPPQRTAGAVVTFRAVPGMTVEWMQRLVDCHLARNASLGHVVPEMPDCPLVPHGVQAQVKAVGGGFAVSVRSDTPETAREIAARAGRLRPARQRDGGQ